jgi:hypothetical protein
MSGHFGNHVWMGEQQTKEGVATKLAGELNKEGRATKM